MSYEDDVFESEHFMESDLSKNGKSTRPSSSSNRYHVGVGSIVTPLQVSKSQSSIPTKTSQPLVRIKIMSASYDTNYRETVETPAQSSLRSLRIFILKTFPYFPTKFLFRVHKNERGKKILLTVPHEQETKYLVGMLPRQEVFVQRHIPIHLDQTPGGPSTPTVVPIKRASTATTGERRPQSQSLPSPLKASLDASHDKMMSLFRAKFDAENNSSLRGSIFEDPRTMTGTPQMMLRPHTASATMENNHHQVRPKTVDNSRLTSAPPVGDDRNRYSNNNYNDDNNMYGGMSNVINSTEVEDRYLIWNEYIPSSEKVSVSLCTSLNLAGIQYNDLKWERFRLHNNQRDCVINFDDDGEYRRFIIDQIVLMRLESLVLRIQMMVRRKLAIIRVQTLRVYLKANPHTPNPPKAEYEIGAQVEARYNGRGDWYPGCVVGYMIKRVKKKPKIHYNILYDDGDRDEALSKDYIRHFDEAAAIEREKIRKAKRKLAGNLSDEEEDRRRIQEEELLKKLVENANAEMEAERAKAEMEHNLKLMQEEAAYEEAAIKATEIAKAAEIKARTERNLLIAKREEVRKAAQEKIDAELRREEQERSDMLHEELYQRRIEELEAIAVAKAIAEAKAKADEEERIRKEMEAIKIRKEEEERQAAIAAAEAARQAQMEAERLAEQKRLLQIEQAKRAEKERMQGALVEAATEFGREQDEIQSQLENFETVRLDRLRREQATLIAQVVKKETRHIVESIVESAKKHEQQRLLKMQLKKAVMLNKGYDVVTDRVIKKADKIISKVEVVEEKARGEQEAVARAIKEKEDAEIAKRKADALAKSQESRDKRQAIIDRENAIKKNNAETLHAVVADWMNDVMKSTLITVIEEEKQKWIEHDRLTRSQRNAVWEQKMRRVGAKVLHDMSRKTINTASSIALMNRVRSIMIDVLGDISVRKSFEEAVRIQIRKSLEDRERKAWQKTMATFFDRIHIDIKKSGVSKLEILRYILPNSLSLQSKEVPMPLDQAVAALRERIPMSISKAETNSIYKAYSIDPLTNKDMLIDVKLLLEQAQLLTEDLGTNMEENIDHMESLNQEAIIEPLRDEKETHVNNAMEDGDNSEAVAMTGKLSHELATTISSWSMSIGMQNLVDAEIEKFDKKRHTDMQKSLEAEKSRAEELRQMETKISLDICQQLSNFVVGETTAAGLDHTMENILPKRIIAAALKDEIMHTAVKKIALKLSVQRRGSVASIKVSRKK